MGQILRVTEEIIINVNEREWLLISRLYTINLNKSIFI